MVSDVKAPDPVHLAQSIQYQDGAVVSRTLVRSAAGTVTLFAFDAAQELSEHTAPFDAWVYVLDGEAEIRLRQQPYLVRQGECFIMPARQPHAVRAVNRFKMVLVMLQANV